MKHAPYARYATGFSRNQVCLLAFMFKVKLACRNLKSGKLGVESFPLGSPCLKVESELMFSTQVFNI